MPDGEIDEAGASESVLGLGGSVTESLEHAAKAIHVIHAILCRKVLLRIRVRSRSHRNG